MQATTLFMHQALLAEEAYAEDYGKFGLRREWF
jgi:hypothetical protein